MKFGYCKVAAVTPKVKVADPFANAGAVIQGVSKAVKQGAKVIVFPELVLTAYTCQDLFYQRTLLKEAEKQLLEIAEKTKEYDAILYIGLPLEVHNKLYNVAAIVFHGEVLGFVTKKYLPNYGEFYEARQFCPGFERTILIDFYGKKVPMGMNLLVEVPEIDGLVIGCEICEDLWTPNPPSTNHACHGATLLVNLSASNDLVGKGTYRKELVKATSARLISGYVYVSAGAGESTQDVVFGGHNIIAENGGILAEKRPFESEDNMIVTEIDIEKLCNDRRRMSTYQMMEDDAYTRLTVSLKKEKTVLTRTYSRTPFVPGNKQLRDHRCEEILTIQAMGLKKRYEHIGCKTAVIGISGGLDSTLALLVCVRAFDALSYDRSGIIAVTMPGFGTTDRTYDNACLLTKTLGATLMEVPIGKSVLKHFEDIGQDPDVHDVTYENGQARERTQILMDIANQKGGLVIGTGDMSELALGFATYNGDHMSMYGVNVGVPKTLVRYLVQFYADTCQQKVLSDVLNDILDTPVSPELLPAVNGDIAQKTEDLVGPYVLHDFFLYHMLRMQFAPTKIYELAKLTFCDAFDEATIKKWLQIFYRRFFAQHFKRSCLPDGPKVGSVAVSPRGDLRMPTDACASLWMTEIERL